MFLSKIIFLLVCDTGAEIGYYQHVRLEVMRSNIYFNLDNLQTRSGIQVTVDTEVTNLHGVRYSSCQSFSFG